MTFCCCAHALLHTNALRVATTATTTLQNVHVHACRLVS